jgi:hypothetical protein
MTIFSSCKETDNFYETTRYFTLDKSEYCPNDTIELTVNITSQKEKKIKLYANYRNLTIWSRLKVPCKIDSIGICDEVIAEHIGRGEEGEIIEVIIKPDSPFKKNFRGHLKLEEGQYSISFPEINYNVVIPADKFLNDSTKLEIHGHCNPINPEFGASMEEYISPKELKIKKGCL